MTTDDREAVKAAKITASGAIITAFIGAIAILVATLINIRQATQDILTLESESVATEAENADPRRVVNSHGTEPLSTSRAGPEVSTRHRWNEVDGDLPAKAAAEAARTLQEPLHRKASEPPHKEQVEVTLMLDSQVSSATILIDGKPAAIVESGLTYVTITVPLGPRTFSIYRRNGHSCRFVHTIETSTTNITPTCIWEKHQ